MEPSVSRPHMPGYGVVAENDGGGLLAWEWAEERLLGSHDYWLATVRVDEARPHVMPVWGVVLDGCLWLSCSPESRKARNLRTNPAVVATTDNPAQPVVVEGQAVEIHDPVLVVAFAHAMDDKYQSGEGVAFYLANATFAITPRVVFALDTDNFIGSPTRWTFGREPS